MGKLEKKVQSNLHNITPLATKEHVIVMNFVVLTWMCDKRELV